MTHLQEKLHDLNALLIYKKIWFDDCPNGVHKEYEYNNCGDCLYLVRHKKSKVMLFVDANTPIEAVDTFIEILNENMNCEVVSDE